MLLQHIVLLALLYLFASTDAASLDAKRMLKIENIGADGIDERGINPDFFHLEKLTNLFKSPNHAQFQSWLNSGQTADDVFRSTVRPTLTLEFGAVVANPQFKIWVTYVIVFSKKHAQERRGKKTLLRRLRSTMAIEGWRRCSWKRRRYGVPKEPPETCRRRCLPSGTRIEYDLMLSSSTFWMKSMKLFVAALPRKYGALTRTTWARPTPNGTTNLCTCRSELSKS
ncbi:hypothetical protein KRP22_004621 [Phytophthora ramorum]